MNRGLVLLLVSVLALFGFAGAVSAAHEGWEVKVDMTPEQEVEDVDSDATGQIHIKVSEDGNSLEYTISATNFENALAGHLHSGAAGENGPVELLLFENAEPMDYNGEIATGTLTAEDLMGDMDWEEFSKALVAGEIYANFHSEQYPGGELRGQLTAGDQMADTASNGLLYTTVGLLIALAGGVMLIGRRNKLTA